jgi:hypothetical protein
MAFSLRRPSATAAAAPRAPSAWAWSQSRKPIRARLPPPACAPHPPARTTPATRGAAPPSWPWMPRGVAAARGRSPPASRPGCAPARDLRLLHRLRHKALQNLEHLHEVEVGHAMMWISGAGATPKAASASNDDGYEADDDGDEGGDVGVDARRARLLNDALDAVVVARAILVRVLDMCMYSVGRFLRGRSVCEDALAPQHSLFITTRLHRFTAVKKKSTARDGTLHCVSPTPSTRSTSVVRGGGSREV